MICASMELCIRIENYSDPNSFLYDQTFEKFLVPRFLKIDLFNAGSCCNEISKHEYHEAFLHKIFVFD